MESWMSEQRRLSVSSHHPRKRATPAYQLRRNQRPQVTEAGESSHIPEPGDESIATEAEQSNTPAPVHSNGRSATGTEAMPVVEPETGEPAATDAAVTPQDHDSPVADSPAFEPDGASVDNAAIEASSDVDATAASDVEAATGVQAADDESDYADYARSVEEAAARSRLEMAPQAAATAAYPAIRPASAASRIATQRPTVRQTRGRPVVGSRVRAGGGGRGNGGRHRTVDGGDERDPRPLMKRPKTWLVVAGIVIAVVAIAGVLWAANIARITYNAYNDAHVDTRDRDIYTVNAEGTPVIVPTEQVQASLPNWDNKDPFNVLLMGIDDRDGDTEPPRSDTMIVMRINPANNGVVMMSIPRDLLVYIPVADRWDKINAAYPIGEEQEEDGGAPAVMETIEANFNVRIHYFVTVDFNGFRSIVDTVGGVIIDVPAPIKDDQYPTEDFGITREYFSTGLQKMDGETALRYSRTRHNDNDIARSDRQQQMLIALREQAMSLGLITKAEELISQMGDMVKTDFNFNQLLALANLGRKVDPNAIAKVNLWDAGVLSEHVPEDEFDPFYFEADWPAVYRLMGQYFNNNGSTQPPPTPTIAVPNEPSASPESGGSKVQFDTPIIVQNDSGLTSLARVVGQIINNTGFTTVSPQTGNSEQTATTIYDYAERPDTARYIAEQLGLDESSIVYGNGGNGIVVSLGSDLAWVLDQ
jgi:LCP family protein required for cell wall assembly